MKNFKGLLSILLAIIMVMMSFSVFAETEMEEAQYEEDAAAYAEVYEEEIEEETVRPVEEEQPAVTPDAEVIPEEIPSGDVSNDSASDDAIAEAEDHIDEVASADEGTVETEESETETMEEIEEKEATGTEGVAFDFNEGTLTINGTGAIADMESIADAPWAEYAAEVTELKIGSGITAIGKNAFTACSALTSAYIPTTVSEIHDTAFAGVTTIELDISGAYTLRGDKAYKTVVSADTAVIKAADNGALTPVKDGGSVKIAITYEDDTTHVVMVKVVDPVPVTSIVFDKTEPMQLWTDYTAEDKLEKITATIEPANATSRVEWSVSPAGIVDIDVKNNTCVVTPKKVGSATITATASNGQNARVAVNVADPNVPVGVSLGGSAMKLNLGASKQMVPTVYGAREGTTPRTTFKWSTSKSSVVSVSTSGVIKGKKEGTATITVATANGKKASIKVTVVDPKKPVSIAITNLTNGYVIEVQKGKKVKLNAKMMPTTAVSKLTWKSKNKKIATVSSSGWVKGKKNGTTTITVKTKNKKTAKIKVKVVSKLSACKHDVCEWKVQDRNVRYEIIEGDREQHTKLWDVCNVKICKRCSANVQIVVLEQNELVEGHDYDDELVCKQCGFARYKPGITLSSTAENIIIDRKVTLSATIADEDMGTVEGTHWRIDDENIATINQDGEVSAITLGTTYAYFVCEYTDPADEPGIVSVFERKCKITVEPEITFELICPESVVLNKMNKIPAQIDSRVKPGTYTVTINGVETAVDSTGNATWQAKELGTLEIEAVLECAYGTYVRNYTVEVVETAADGNYEYRYMEDGNVSIAKYKGTATAVTIPSAYAGTKITEIGKEAFKGSKVTKIVIPTSIETIGEGAFANCTSLVAVR